MKNITAKIAKIILTVSLELIVEIIFKFFVIKNCFKLFLNKYF